MATGRARFIKAALMTHASAAYLLILSVLGILEQTRDLLISEAAQQRWHIDKLRLPFWFWVLLILGVVIWRLVDHSYKEIRERDARIEKYECSFSSKWEGLAALFENLQNRWQHTAPLMVRTQWQHGGLGWNGEKIIEQWTMGGPGYLDILPLCKKAGVMLLHSPRVLATLSERVKNESDLVDRWLYYLKENHDALKLDRHHGVYANTNGKQQIVMIGEIPMLGAASARACRDCAASELF